MSLAGQGTQRVFSEFRWNGTRMRLLHSYQGNAMTSPEVFVARYLRLTGDVVYLGYRRLQSIHASSRNLYLEDTRFAEQRAHSPSLSLSVSEREREKLSKRSVTNVTARCRHNTQKSEVRGADGGNHLA